MDEFETLSEQLARVTAECERLREENARLCRLLSEQAHPATPAKSEPAQPQPSTPHELSVPEKIALFRSLFRGREDVYALRWESADGKSGYSPASIRDWKAVMSVPPAERKKLDQEGVPTVVEGRQRRVLHATLPAPANAGPVVDGRGSSPTPTDPCGHRSCGSVSR